MKARGKWQKHVVNVARREYATDDVEIDDNPRISPSDGGTWVAAWVWVSDPIAEEHKD
jgi:hypothetical protein